MAEENNQEEEKKSPIKLILMIVGGIVLLGAGLGIGMFIGGDDSSDPSTEISQIIEKKENPEVSEEESNLQEGKISIKSPIGMGLLGKKKGEIVSVNVPSGKIKFKIIDISL